MSGPTTSLRIAVSTASFLPATALSFRAVRGIVAGAVRRGFAGTEILATRCIVAAASAAPRREGLEQLFGGPVCSVHEVWNPSVSTARQVGNVLLKRPQSRGMTPYPMDCVFFRDGPVSEAAMIRLAEAACVPAVVSELESPFAKKRYDSDTVCVQVHPDLGPAGAHLELPLVAEIIHDLNYGVVLDTNHVRRRVRLHPGRTEMAPPLARPGEPSLGGIWAVWQRLGERVRLVHFQATGPAELDEILRTRELPRGLDALRDLLPVLAHRRIPVVLEIGASALAGAMALRGATAPRGLRFGLDAGAVWDACETLRGVLAKSSS